MLDSEIEAAGRAGSRVPIVERLPPHLWFVWSAIFHYLGPAFAVLLFARVSVGGVAWMRIVSAAIAFALWRRPWRIIPSLDRSTRRLIVALGAVFAVMNYSFYHAIDDLPLGTVAAIEFVGPIALALIGSRSGRNLAALALAVGGVWLLTDVRLEGSTTGFAWALANGVLFTAYIVLAHRISRAQPDTSPLDRLGLAMIVAGLAITPLGLADATTVFLDPIALAAGVGVGLSSSVIPYVFDQFAMTRLPRSTYALFVALLPATAVVVGVIVLAQIPTAVEVLAVGLVIAGVALHRERPHAEPAVASARPPEPMSGVPQPATTTGASGTARRLVRRYLTTTR
ncbi:MAG: EamA family transporter [Actinomycetota bacterium]